MLKPTLEPMIVLQDKLYNTVVAALGLGDIDLQLSVPAPPLPASDPGLWAACNALPPFSLTWNRAAGAAAFFPEYAAVVEELSYAPSLSAVIGDAAYAAWTSYLDGLSPRPTLCEQAPLFRTWANKNGYPGVAVAGASNLAAACIFSQQQAAVLPYQGPHAKPVDFVGGYDALRSTVALAPAGKILFDSRKASGDVSGTWAGGLQLALQGLWTGSSPTERVSRAFAASVVELSASLQHWTTWSVTPGGWYSSALLHVAYSTPASPPWPADPHPSWDDVFGPRGSMLRFPGALVVADGLTLTSTSTARFGAADREAITAAAAGGLWPFYMPSGGPVSNTVAFDALGRMTVTTRSAAGHPFVIGGAVVPVARYLGG